MERGVGKVEGDKKPEGDRKGHEEKEREKRRERESEIKHLVRRTKLFAVFRPDDRRTEWRRILPGAAESDTET